MSSLQSNYAVLFFVVVHLLGLAAAWLARASQGSDGHALCQGLFLVFLALVGAAAIAMVQSPSGVWVFSGMTLSVMIVGTTCDFRPAERVHSR